jgi:hypothetical protein
MGSVYAPPWRQVAPRAPHQRNQVKGTFIMPDIQTAFQLALAKTKAHIPTTIPADWDDENPNATVEVTTTQGGAAVPKAAFVVTNNVTRETFNHIKDNPGKTRAQAVQSLEQRGFLPKSTTSLISQMVRQDLIREVQGLLYAQATEYRPLKTAKVFKAQEPVAEKPVAKKLKTPVAEVQAEPAPQINAAWDADTLLNNLSIKQARALYDELRKIFGG